MKGGGGVKKHGAFWMHLYPLLLFAIIVLSLLFLIKFFFVV